MIKEPASKEWFKKWGSPKSKALKGMSENQKLWKKFPNGPTSENREKVMNEHMSGFHKSMKEYKAKFKK